MASASSDENEFKEMVTCGICFFEFDIDIRKPKFLPCSHTVCLLCLKEIFCSGLVTCPICRNTSIHFDVSTLPNNNYALHMLKLKEQKPEQTNAHQLSWCFTCGTTTKTMCTLSEHSSVNVTANTMKNLEAFLSLKEELESLKTKGADKLALAIQKRKKIEKHLNLLIKSVTSTLEGIQDLQDENNLLMTELVSMLEGSTLSASSNTEDSKDFFLSGLCCIIGDANPNDTVETLKLKFNKSTELCEQSIRVASAAASNYERCKKMRITVNLFDEENHRLPTCPFFEDGFRLMNTNGADSLANVGQPVRQDLLLLSHVVFSLLRKQNVDLGHEQQGDYSEGTTALSIKNDKSKISASPLLNSKSLLSLLDPLSDVLPSTSHQDNSIESSTPTFVALPMPSRKEFVLGQSIFILRLSQSGVLKSEIHVQTAAKFYPEFMKKLGKFCHKSPKPFSTTVVKAVPGVYVLFNMANPQFQPVEPEMIANFPHLQESSVRETASHFTDVGINTVNTTVDKKVVTGWNFVFLLENYAVSKYAMHLKSLRARRFGRVVHRQMLDEVNKLSSTSKSKRTGYTLTLESR